MNLEPWGWGSDPSNMAALDALEQAGLALGRVVSEQRGRYRVQAEAGECIAQVSGQLRHQLQTAAEFPTVGDWVGLQLSESPGAGIIHQRLPRRSQFVRKAAGGTTAAQVVAANVDTVFIVVGLDGDFNLRRIERYLVMAQESGAQPVVVLNKADTCDDVAGREKAVVAIATTIPIHAISAQAGTGLEALAPHLRPGHTVALLGSSGTGKSTLTNALLGQPVQATRAVRADDSRGRHTTTARQLLPLPGGALLIDTPGMRELQLWSADAGLASTFADVEALAEACRFRDCRHQGEPGCAVQAAVEAGRLASERLASYQKLQREHAWVAQRQDQRASLNSKRRWKAMNKAMRHHPKRP